jgi:hypothetical protein
MGTPQEYLNRTKSAVTHIFNGIDAYLQVLRNHRPPVLVGTYSSEADHAAAVDQWMKEKAEDIQKGLSAERAFLAEKYALAALCGSLLQIASMALRLYSKHDQVPAELSEFVKAGHAPYCIGRRVRGVPLGLVILAGRNQYNHIDDDGLRDPNVTVFEWLATKHAYGAGVRDPGFDLRAGLVWNYPSNITSLIGWRSYEVYDSDMRSLLGT